MSPRNLDSHDDVLAADLPDWRQVLNVLRARFRTGDFATGLALVDRIGAAAEAADHHPDIIQPCGFQSSYGFLHRIKSKC